METLVESCIENVKVCNDTIDLSAAGQTEMIGLAIVGLIVVAAIVVAVGHVTRKRRRKV